MTLSRHRFRILGDIAVPFATPVDLLRPEQDQTIRIPRGVDIQIEFAAGFLGGAVDISNITSLTMEMKALRQGRYAPLDTAPLLATATVASEAFTHVEDLDIETFRSGSADHLQATIVLTAGETANLPAGPVWLVILGITDDAPSHKVLYVAGRIEAVEDGQGSGTPPAEPQVSYYTAAEADARFIQAVPEDSNARWVDGKLLIREVSPVPGWREVYLVNGAFNSGPLVPDAE